MNEMDQIRARRFYAQIDDDSSEDAYPATDNINVKFPSEGHGKREVLKSVLAPYSHTYMAVVRSLTNLRDYGMMETDFIKACVKEITNSVDSGHCKYGMCHRIYKEKKLIYENKMICFFFQLTYSRKHFHRYDKKLYENVGKIKLH